MTWLDALLQNEVLAGIVGGAGISTVFYQLRELPLQLWGGAKRQLTVELIVDNSDDLFTRLAIYLSRHRQVTRARWLRMVESYNDEDQKWEWAPSFGFGWHLIKDHESWFLIYRNLDEKSGGISLVRRETFTIRTLGRSQAAIRGLMRRSELVYEQSETVRIYAYHDGDYLLVDRKPARRPETIFIPDDQKQRLFADLDRFLVSRERYRHFGIPYRRGYLLKGPPGTGKTTMAFALACRANRPVYMINLNTCGGDTGLLAAFNRVEAGGFVIIEDADTSQVSHERTTSDQPAPSDDAKNQVTLAGLLNAIDGIASRENRILVLTSNYAEKLDAALVRPGRIDVQETIGLIAEPEARAMAVAFLGHQSDWFQAEIVPQLPMSPATLQGLLLSKQEGAS